MSIITSADDCYAIVRGHSPSNAATTKETIFTADYPQTVNLKQLTYSGNANLVAGADFMATLLVVVRQGETAGDISLSPDGDLYTPCRDIIFMYSMGAKFTSAAEQETDGATIFPPPKFIHLQVGDKVVGVSKGSAPQTWTVKELQLWDIWNRRF